MRSGGTKGNWTYDGKIYLRRKDGKKVTVRYEEDLLKFEQESARVKSDIYYTQNLIPRSLHVTPRTSLAPIVEVAIRTRSSVTLG